MLIVSLVLDCLFTEQHYAEYEARPFDYLTEYLPSEARRLPVAADEDLDVTQELRVVC